MRIFVREQMEDVCVGNYSVCCQFISIECVHSGLWESYQTSGGLRITLAEKI